MNKDMAKNRRLLLYVVVSFFWFSLYAYVPQVTPYADYLGASMRMMGLVAGAYGLTQMIIRFPLGIFSDKLRRRKIFVQLGIGFATVSAFLAFFFPSPTTLLIMRGLGGVAASVWVAFTVLGASYYKSDESTKVMGHMSAANAFGRMVALLLGGLIAQLLGVPYAFLLGGIAGVIGLVFSFWVTEKRPEEGQKPPNLAGLLEVAGNKQLLFCSILGILAMYISFATTFGFTPLVATQMEASQLQLGMLGVLSTAPAIFISPLAGTIMPKKFGASATLVIGFVIAGAGSALVAISNSLWMLFTVQIAASLGGAIVGTLLLGLCISDISGEKRATAMGFFQAVYGLGMFLGPFVTGHISHGFGLMAAFVFTGAVGFAGAVLSVVFGRRSWKI
ncbi:MAG: MFS transporter [Firmicutes bacterium]|nr:MFS transporter [Bacillota bacterium]